MTKIELRATSNELFKLPLKIGNVLPAASICVHLLQYSRNEVLNICILQFIYHKLISKFGFCSHVHAAYASFLWETEDNDDDDDDDDDGTCRVDPMPPLLHGEAMASVVS